MAQNVLPVDLDVELVKAASRLFLGLTVQLDLQHPDLAWCFQTHRQSPHLCFFTSAPEVRALPSAGVTRLHRYLWPSPTPGLAAVLPNGVGVATSTSSGSPSIT